MFSNVLAFLLKYKWLVGIVVVSLLFIWIAYGYGTYHPNPNSELVRNYVEDQLKKERVEFESQINQKTARIKDRKSVV